MTCSGGVGITPTIFWPREYGRGSKTLQIIWKGPPYVFTSIYSTRTCKPWKTWQNNFFFAFVMWTGPSTKHLVEVAATQIQHWSLVLNTLLYLLSMAKSSAAEKIPIKKLTYIIHEVWSNLCIPFSSVKKRHSLSSLFTNTGYHVQYLTLAITWNVLSCALLHLPILLIYPAKYTATLVFQFCECHLGCSHAVRGAKQMEALCKRGLSLVSVLLGSSKIVSISSRKTKHLQEVRILTFCKVEIFVLANKPTWLTYACFSCFIPVLLLICVKMYPVWPRWERELCFTLSSERMVREKNC